MRCTIIISLIILIFSCQKRKDTFVVPKKDTLTTTNNSDSTLTINSISNYDSIVNLVKFKGNKEAYDELFYYLMDSNKGDRTDTVMYYSEIMAEKFNNEGAYLDYFKALCEKYNIDVDYSNYNSIDISSLDPPIKKQAENWLHKMLDKKIITKEQYNSIKK